MAPCCHLCSDLLPGSQGYNTCSNSFSPIHSSICPPIHSFIHSSTFIRPHPSIHLFISIPPHPSIHLSTFIPPHPSVCSSSFRLIHPSIYPPSFSLHPFIHLFISIQPPSIHPFIHLHSASSIRTPSRSLLSEPGAVLSFEEGGMSEMDSCLLSHMVHLFRKICVSGWWSPEHRV